MYHRKHGTEPFLFIKLYNLGCKMQEGLPIDLDLAKSVLLNITLLNLKKMILHLHLKTQRVERTQPLGTRLSKRILHLF